MMLTQFTLVCNGALWIERNLRHHAPLVDRQVVVEGASNDGRLGNGLSITGGSPHSTDGTIEILRRLEKELPNLRVVYSAEIPWQGKTTMCNAALKHCELGALLQIDADEFWFPWQVAKMRELLESTLYTDFEFFARNFWPTVEYHPRLDRQVWGNTIAWRRLFRWSGERWISHEPPMLARSEKVMGMLVMRDAGLIMMHYGHAVKSENARREIYYNKTPGVWTAIRDNWLKTKDLNNLGIYGSKLVKYDGPHPIDITFMLDVPPVKPEQLPTLFKPEFVYSYWSRAYINALATTPSEPEDYPKALLDLRECLDELAEPVALLKILVVGSISPWVECWLLNQGADKVYTTDINKLYIASDHIIYLSPEELRKHRFHLIVAYSTVEHIGLGRYGDPVDENGDIYFMRDLRNLLVSEGVVLLGIPVAEKYAVEFPWHRLYGMERIMQLARGFHLMFSYKRGARSDTVDLTFDPRYRFNWQNQPVLALSKRSAFISFVLVSRNDGYAGDSLGRLRTSLQLNLKSLRSAFGSDFEILIGDWGSADRFTRVMLGIEDDKEVRLFYFPPQLTAKYPSEFDEVHPLNFLTRQASGQFVARLDQDIILGSRFIENAPHLKGGRLYWSTRRDLEEGVYEESDIRSARNCPNQAEFRTAAIGIIIASKIAWESVQGYNEALIHRNHMEHDLCDRLMAHVGPNFLVNFGELLDSPFYHIYHDTVPGQQRKWNKCDAVFANDSDWGMAKAEHLVVEV